MDIYFHIGASKTGTSAIQSFLAYNQDLLKKMHSCEYPNISILRQKDKFYNHCMLFSLDPSETKGHISDIISRSKRDGMKKIVISCEGLLENIKYVKPLHEAVMEHEGVRPHVIVYLRRQDHWLESAWKQWGVKDPRFQNIDEYYQNRHIRWLQKVGIWSDIFGKDAIRVWPYEKEQLPDGLIEDFLGKIGIDGSTTPWITPDKGNVNYNFGFNREVVEVIRLNKNFFKNVHDNRLFTFFSEYLPDRYRKEPFEGYSLLSPAQRRTIVREYEPMNQEIARDYLGRADGKLFLEPWPEENEPWEPYDGITLEQFVPMVTEILYNMNHKYEKNLGLLRKNPLFRVYQYLLAKFS